MDDNLTALARAASPGPWVAMVELPTRLGLIRDGDGREVLTAAYTGDQGVVHAQLAALAPDLATLLPKAAKALRRRVSEQSGHFLDCPASEEIIHFGWAPRDSCCCADDLAILAAYDKLEAKIPEVPRG
jgi:hypothetical protein